MKMPPHADTTTVLHSSTSSLRYNVTSNANNDDTSSLASSSSSTTISSSTGMMTPDAECEAMHTSASDCSSENITNNTQGHRSSQSPPCLPLGIVLDIDGTLVAENEDPDIFDPAFIRPGVIDFLLWCRERGHSLALWTAGHASWAHYIAWKLSTLVTAKAAAATTVPVVRDTNSTNQSGMHSRPASCQVQNCHSDRRNGGASEATKRNDDPELFAFVWSQERLRVRQRIPVSTHGEYEGCRWCEAYRMTCTRCECHGIPGKPYGGGLFSCPCRSTKDLSKVWRHQKKLNRKLSSNIHHGTSKPSQRQCSTGPFTRQRTILVENTPQQCIRNYGNAVYVPTYTGDASAAGGDHRGLLDDDGDFPFFLRLRHLILQLEHVEDVRTVMKCHHPPRHYGGPHACYEQSWWHARPSESPPLCVPLSTGGRSSMTSILSCRKEHHGAAKVVTTNDTIRSSSLVDVITL